MSESATTFIPITQAALELDTTENEVIMLIEKDELHGKMIDGTWYIDQSTLNDYNKSENVIKTVGCGICGRACGGC